MQRKGLKSVEVIIVGEYVCTLVCLPNTGTRDKEPFIYLLTNLDEPEVIGAFYRLRWTIECCFGHLKTNGFDLEAQGFKKEHRVEIIMAVLVLLYTLCLISGVLQQTAQQNQNPKANTKNYANGKTYPCRSLFRTDLQKITTQANSLKFNLLMFVDELFLWLSTEYNYT